MVESLLELVIFLGIGFSFTYAAWWIIPILSGLPWIPTQPQRIRKSLTLAQVRPGEVVYDLGAGDGRVLLIAAGEYGAYAVGVEISPLHCLLAWLRARVHHLSLRVRILWASFYKVDLAEADVVFVYMTAKQAARLQPHLERQLHPEARVVAISVEFAGWQAVDFDRQDLVFLYRMPPAPHTNPT